MRHIPYILTFKNAQPSSNHHCRSPPNRTHNPLTHKASPYPPVTSPLPLSYPLLSRRAFLCIIRSIYIKNDTPSPPCLFSPSATLPVPHIERTTKSHVPHVLWYMAPLTDIMKSKCKSEYHRTLHLRAMFIRARPAAARMAHYAVCRYPVLPSKQPYRVLYALL